MKWSMGQTTSKRRFRRSLLLFPIDIISILFAFLFSFELRFNWEIPSQFSRSLFVFLAISFVVYLSAFLAFRLYTRIWRYAGFRDVEAILIANAMSAVVVKLCDFAFANMNLPLSVWFSSFLLTLSLVGGVRLIILVIGSRGMAPTPVAATTQKRSRVLIYGAGAAGSIVVKESLRDHAKPWKIIGFIDDDIHKHGFTMSGVKILGGRLNLDTLISEYEIDTILIAIPSLPRQSLREYVDELQKHKCAILIIPPFTRWVVDNLYAHIRPVQVEDLLGRDSLPVDVSKVGQYLKGQRILVTGAGGSIGSEICRQVSALSPAELILLGRGENSIFEIQQELQKSYPSLKLPFVIADVRDSRKMSAVFQEFSPDVVFHAAAHKHVPLMEAHPDEAFMNNIIATKSLGELASNHGVKRFIMISSDKAVRPANVMGASKRVAEMAIQQQARQSSGTKFITVRFGNVLGSRGSVVRVFRQQIESGGPVTVTDERMVRYFMTIPEAVRLVVEAGADGVSGEVYLLDMGEPVRIIDLAERMIRLSGLEPGVDIPIQVTGIRPGEKLYEELSRESDSATLDSNARIWGVNCPPMRDEEFTQAISHLTKLYTENDARELARAIKTLAWWEPVTTAEKEVASAISTLATSS